MGGIDSNEKRRIAVGDRPRDVIVGPGRVAAHIELEHAQRIGRGLGHRFEAGIAHRAQHMGDAEFARRLDHRLGAAGMKAFQRAYRTEHDRQPQLFAEDFGGGIDLADVAQHPRPERHRIERHAVSPQCRFGLGAADNVIPFVLIEIGAGLGDDLVQILKLVRDRCIGGGARGIGIWHGALNVHDASWGCLGSVGLRCCYLRCYLLLAVPTGEPASLGFGVRDCRL